MLTGGLITEAPSAPLEKNDNTRSIRLCGLGLLLLFSLLAACLLTYNGAEMGWDFLNKTDPEIAAKLPCTNALGIIGLYTAGFLLWIFGAGAIYICLLMLIIGWGLLVRPAYTLTSQTLAALIMLICVCAVLSIQPGLLENWRLSQRLENSGGKLGYLDGTLTAEALLGTAGALILFIAAHGIALIYFSRFGLKEFCRAAASDIRSICARLRTWRLQRKRSKAISPTAWKLPPSDQPESQPRPQELPLELSSPPQPRESAFENPSNPPEDPRGPPPRGNEEPLPAPMERQLAQAELRRKEKDTPAQRPPSSRGRQYAPTRNGNLLDLMNKVEKDIESSPLPPPEEDGPSRDPLPLTPGLAKLLNLNKAKPAAPPAKPRAPRPEQIKKTAEPAQQVSAPPPPTDDYPLPPYSLLTFIPTPPEMNEAAASEMRETQERIIDTLNNFKVSVSPGEITRGPSITRYEFYPPAGYRVSRICSLSKDLMMSTSSKSINILAPIPGKNTVGIELENENKSPVYLRELLQSPAFKNPKLRIPVALGKDVYGNAVIGDLAAMPHTLVAGTTGSGKSVCINSMILSMLYKFRPDELRLILVDPKVVEMQPYKKLPHLACPVVTNPARVIGALRWAVNEMEHRYSLFSRCGVRNFEDFNNRADDGEAEEEEEEDIPDNPNFDIEAFASEIERQSEREIPLEEEQQDEFDFDERESIPRRLPYIVIFIDELADLMMVVKEDLENYIARLTQKARAAGIHLVVATQTPRSNVVTGIIKANIPSRIALKVSSTLDSRIILDMAGAENLLGKGDFLFLPPGGISKLTRAQGAFVSDAEIASIIKFCASHASQHFDQSVTAEMNNADGSAMGNTSSPDGGLLSSSKTSAEDDELYTRCVSLVVTERKASTSLLQRRFSIGYGRAAKIMDLMQERGVISPPIGATNKREILVESPED